eukprot:1151889-Pelagomonas_calceolata.AAC.7
MKLNLGNFAHCTACHPNLNTPIKPFGSMPCQEWLYESEMRAGMGPEDVISTPVPQGPCPCHGLKLEAHQEAMTDAAVLPFPWPRGQLSPSLLAQSYQVLSEEPTGAENTQGGAEMGLKSLFDKERGGVSILRAWCGLPPAPSGPAPQQGGVA